MNSCGVVFPEEIDFLEIRIPTWETVTILIVLKRVEERQDISLQPYLILFKRKVSEWISGRNDPWKPFRNFDGMKSILKYIQSVQKDFKKRIMVAKDSGSCLLDLKPSDSFDALEQILCSNCHLFDGCRLKWPRSFIWKNLKQRFGILAADQRSSWKRPKNLLIKNHSRSCLDQWRQIREKLGLV